MTARRCTLLDEDGPDDRCMLEAGHPGVCMPARTVEINWGDAPEECDIEIDFRGGGARCTRPRGHDGPHAAGWSLTDPDVCGETERGTGRICLRQPHPAWPDAHNFGKPDEDMRIPPEWWDAEAWGPWPAGPIGAIPDMPWWFQNPGRPADDHETITNQQNVEEIKARRHTGGGHGYGEGSDHVSVGDVRAQIRSAIEQLEQTSAHSARAVTESDQTIAALFSARTALREAVPPLARMVAGGEENGTLSAARHWSISASDAAALGAQLLRLAAGDDAAQDLDQAADLADQSDALHIVAGNAIFGAATEIERASNLINEAVTALEAAVAQTQSAKTQISGAAAPAQQAADAAEQYLGRL